MLQHLPIGPLADGTHGVGYQTPGCTSKTIIGAGMTAARAIEESIRLNEEQEQRAVKVQRDYEHRNRVLGLTPVIDFLPDWTPDTPAAFAARLAEADAKQGRAHAAGQK